MKITHEKLKILSALMSGSKTHKMLRLAYYGEERCKNPSNTSFYNQLGRMMDEDLIAKSAVGMYVITELGKAAIPGWDCDFCGEVSNYTDRCSSCGESKAASEADEHPCARCNTMIDKDMEYCVGCQEDRKAGGR